MVNQLTRRVLMRKKFKKNPIAFEVESSGPFNQKQINYINKLMKYKPESSPTTPSASMAHIGSAFFYLVLNKFSPWIIDSGASNQ